MPGGAVGQRSIFEMTYLDEMYKIAGIEQTLDQLAPTRLYSCFHDNKQYSYTMIHKLLLMQMSHRQKLYQFLLSHSKPAHFVRFIVSSISLPELNLYQKRSGKKVRVNQIQTEVTGNFS